MVRVVCLRALLSPPRGAVEDKRGDGALQTALGCSMTTGTHATRSQTELTLAQYTAEEETGEETEGEEGVEDGEKDEDSDSELVFAWSATSIRSTPQPIRRHGHLCCQPSVLRSMSVMRVVVECRSSVES